MLGGSCASAAGAIKDVPKTVILIIAAAAAKIVGLIAVSALIFTQRKIAGIWF
jgi:hypothetical protein